MWSVETKNCLQIWPATLPSHPPIVGDLNVYICLIWRWMICGSNQTTFSLGKTTTNLGSQQNLTTRELLGLRKGRSLLVLNGRTLGGDTGKPTSVPRFCHGHSTSVIDYRIASAQSMSAIVSWQVNQDTNDCHTNYQSVVLHMLCGALHQSQHIDVMSPASTITRVRNDAQNTSTI